MKKCVLGILFLIANSLVMHAKENHENQNLQRAEITLQALYENYGIEDSFLLRETYPFDENYAATYLASDEQVSVPNPYAYLWPYSGTFSAVSALYEKTKEKKYKTLLDEKILVGLQQYLDVSRHPAGYASYISSAPQSDRFYDDNVWLGIDYTDMFVLTQESPYLDKAKLIWDFVVSGMDDVLGGGIYWCEQKKRGKNTCSNAPGTVFALKMFRATGDSIYFNTGKKLYEWTKDRLQDTTDYLYWDNVKLDGRIDKTKFSYNSGQMMQAAALLYNITGKQSYLVDAERVAKGCYDYFFEDFRESSSPSIRLLKGNLWFAAVMMRGYVELYHITGNKIYIDAFDKSLSVGWRLARDENGLFNGELDGSKKDDSKWLLTQAAIVEMYARLAMIE